MGCCGGRKEGKEEHASSPENPINENRKCRDVLFLLIFIAFWGGMFVIGGFALNRGILERLQYGMDKYGQLCGYKATDSYTISDDFNNRTTIAAFDFTERKKLYYLDPLEMFNPVSILTGKAICVPGCPSRDVACDPTDLTTCDVDANFYCPYAGQVTVDGTSLWTSGLDALTDAYNTQYWSLLDSSFDSVCTSPSLVSLLSGDDVGSEILSVTGGDYCKALSLVPRQGPCYAIYIPTKDIYNRCVPDTTDMISGDALVGTGGGANTTVKDFIESGRAQRYAADILRGIMLILVAGLGGGIVLSLVWLVILRIAAGFMAWSVIVSVNLLAAGCTIMASQKAGLTFTGKAGEIQAAASDFTGIDPSKQDRRIWEVATYVGIGLTCLIFLFTLLILRRVKIAVACLKSASQAVAAIPMLIVFPIVPFLVYCAFVVWWIFVASLLWTMGPVKEKRINPEAVAAFQSSLSSYIQLGASSGGDFDISDFPSPNDGVSFESTRPPTVTCADDPYCYYAITWNKDMRYVFIYHIFGFLWTTQFLIGVCSTVLAGAVASFYWARGERSNMPRSPILAAVRRTFRYHLGSIALGSFIIAVVQFIRLVIEYINRKTQEAQNANKALKIIMCCARYCAWYIEWILRFINRNTYILIAVKGDGYCSSAMHAIKLIVSNALRMAAVNTVGDFLIFLGKLTVAVGCGFGAFLLSDLNYYNDPVAHPDTALSSPLVPVLISFIVAWISATIFFQVYEMAVDTILLCFCEDADQNGGTPLYAPKLLLQAIGESQASIEKKRQKLEAKIKGAKVDETPQ